MLSGGDSLAGPLPGLRAAVLVGLLLAACIHDVRSRRIPNGLSSALLLLGIMVAMAVGGWMATAQALLTCAMGLALWLPFHIFGKLGAGDVKLFAAAAAWLSPLAVVDAAFFAAFAGGLLAAAWMVGESGVAGGWLRTVYAARYREALVTGGEERRRKLPYGIAMSVGITLSYFGLAIFGQ
jgi:prepilin peptidase CpaA